MTAKPVRLRVAPSPTGDPHVGTAYMSLFNLAFARKMGGQFVLRIEDTDRARFQADSESQIFQTLQWLGLNWDEGPDIGGAYAPYRQSERLDTYQPFVDKLIAAGHAYHCWCSTQRLTQLRESQQRSKTSKTGYDRLCLGKTREERAQLPGFTENPVVRMLIPDDVPLSFTDLVRGEIKAPPPDDQVILKADGFPTYHLAVVVDDHLMGITHVARGEEWISSTPKHLLLYKWIGAEPPAFAHLPLLRNTDKSKISKRNNPAARLMWFREQGYLPQALLNFLQLMGYPCAEGQEVCSFADFAADFDWAKINTVGPVFDLKKLDWLNGYYIRQLPVADLAGRIVAYLVENGTWSPAPATADVARLTAAVPLIQERLTTLSEAWEKIQFLFIADDELVIDPQARQQLSADASDVIATAVAALRQLEYWNAAAIHEILQAALVDELGIKPKFAFGPLRVAITGARVSPPLFESMEILGKESSLARLRAF